MLATLAATAVAAVFAPAAMAYWDFTGNLPGPNSGGNRWYVKYVNVSPGGNQEVRMSWTVGSHCMYMLEIDDSGSWHNDTLCGTDPWCNYYDCNGAYYTESIRDRFGCHNPSGLPTVWVNCRATTPV